VLDSATVRSRASSRRTGILAIGQTFLKAVFDASSARSTTIGSNGMPFSYNAMSALWQKDASGWK
jgi:hypothetical protein